MSAVAASIEPERDGDTALIPRQTVDHICGWRNKALNEYARAFDALTEAQDAIKGARVAMTQFAGGITVYTECLDRERRQFLNGMDLPDADEYRAAARKTVDALAWAKIVDHCGIERLMDAKAKEEFREALMADPPEVTVENVRATVEGLICGADEIFKRGIANCFSGLDRRFRSHDGFKVGSRIILTRAFSDSGCWNHYVRNSPPDALRDVERAFYVLDGKELPDNYGGIVGAIEKDRQGLGYGGKQSETDTEYFLARAYINGNLHLWFKRDDLVEKVNKLLAEYYGEVIGDTMRREDADPEAPLRDTKLTQALNFGFFPTPDRLVAEVMDAANIRAENEVLEPSAGTGNLAMAAKGRGAIVDCYEIQPDLVAGLRGRGFRYVQCRDFLTVAQAPIYDRVVMNPPFDRERDIDHVNHALKFLKPEGKLVAIMSAGTEFRETKKAQAFRAKIEKLGGRFRDLPPRSFSDQGTNVNVCLLIVGGGRWG